MPLSNSRPCRTGPTCAARGCKVGSMPIFEYNRPDLSTNIISSHTPSAKHPYFHSPFTHTAIWEYGGGVHEWKQTLLLVCHAFAFK